MCHNDRADGGIDFGSSKEEKSMLLCMLLFLLKMAGPKILKITPIYKLRSDCHHIV
jgi:hypothetical protein